MDAYYSMENAASHLEKLALDRYNSTHSGVQLSRVTSVTASYEIATIDSVWKLVEQMGDRNRTDYQEVTARFQGILCQHSLPPFTDKVGRNSQQAKYLRQSVMIGGIGTNTFDRVVNAVVDIHETFSRVIGKDRLNECEMVTLHSDTDTLALQASNRYFTSRTGSESAAAFIPLPNDIDPHGYLTRAAGSDLYYGVENEVEYFLREQTLDNDYTYIPTKPISFEVGDIVEAQVSFATVPLKGGRFKTTMILRGLTLLDSKFSQTARSRRAAALTSAVRVRKNIHKRKADYQDELLSVTRARLSQFTIGNQCMVECHRKPIENDHHEDDTTRFLTPMKGMDTPMSNSN